MKRQILVPDDAKLQSGPMSPARRTAIEHAIRGFSVAAIATPFLVSDPQISQASTVSRWHDVKADFGAIGNGIADDTTKLMAAINTGSKEQRPVFIPPGSYKITQTLEIPSNTMLIGSSPGLGFGCRLEPEGCGAFRIGGATQSFACLIQDLMIWPKGDAPDNIISIDNSYSVVFRNVRIHEAQAKLGRAAVVMLGDSTAGGHGQCNNIIWENLIVRNDGVQPGKPAVLSTRGCGTHKFIAPDLENYLELFTWQGGGIDIVSPHGERAGRYAFNCREVDEQDRHAYLNIYGGVVTCSPSGIACAIDSRTRRFNSFGTIWANPDANDGPQAVYVYGVPMQPAVFHGVVPDPTGSGPYGYAGIAGWERAISFPDYLLRSVSSGWNASVPPNGQTAKIINLKGVRMGRHWVRVNADGDLEGVQISAYVSANDAVTVVAQNNTAARAGPSSVTLYLEAGWL